MRILLVAPEFPPQLGGMETYAYELARALSASHDVCVLCRQGSENVPGAEVLPAFTGDDPSSEVLEAVERFRPDVVHLLNAGLSPMIPELRERNVPAVVTVHGKDYFQPWLSSREEVKAALSSAKGMIAVSDILRKCLIKDGLTDSRISVVRHGVDNFLFKPWKKITREKPTLLTVARLIPRKNLEVVIDALKNLFDEFPGMEYNVIGPPTDKEYADRLTRRAAQNKLSGHVHFLGEVAHKRLPQYYGQAEVFILLTKPLSNNGTAAFGESFGISYLEAMACALPVVLSKESGMAEFIGKAGIAVPADDVERITAELAALLKDRERRVKMGKEARRIAEQHTWERCVSLTVGVYEKALAASRSG